MCDFGQYSVFLVLKKKNNAIAPMWWNFCQCAFHFCWLLFVYIFRRQKLIESYHDSCLLIAQCTVYTVYPKVL